MNITEQQDKIIEAMKIRGISLKEDSFVRFIDPETFKPFIGFETSTGKKYSVEFESLLKSSTYEKIKI